MSRFYFCFCFLALQTCVTIADEPRLSSAQARDAAQFVLQNHDDNGNRARSATNARISQLKDSRPDSTQAIKTILVPGFSRYIRSNYKNNGNTSQGRVTRLVKWLGEFGEDAKDSLPILKEVKENAGRWPLASAATEAIKAILHRRVVGRITAADPATRRITLNSKGKEWNLLVPEDVRIDGRTLAGFVEVTFDEETKRVFDVKPVDF